MSNKKFTKKLTKYVIWHKTKKKFLGSVQFFGYSEKIKKYCYEVYFLNDIETLTNWDRSYDYKSSAQLKLDPLKNAYISEYGSCFDKEVSFDDLEIRKIKINYEMD